AKVRDMMLPRWTAGKPQAGATVACWDARHAAANCIELPTAPAPALCRAAGTRGTGIRRAAAGPVRGRGRAARRRNDGPDRVAEDETSEICLLNFPGLR